MYARRLAFLLLLPVWTACSVSRPEPIPHRPRHDVASTLNPLDDAHASEFRRAFEDAKDRGRYVVALSPT